MKRIYLIHKKAFTLIELLVVISIIGLLMAILLPSLAAARSMAREIICRSNIRQLFLANTSYADNYLGHYVPAASDMGTGVGLHRWHGVRENTDEAFDPLLGPLALYLVDGKIKECPGRVNFFKGETWSESYEKGCGGYGYNQTYIGSCLWAGWTSMPTKIEAYKKTTVITAVRRPEKTLMFADCAMSMDSVNFIEYSFAEPVYHVNYTGKPATNRPKADPSIHFRHRGRANVVWCDGHVGSEEILEEDGENVYSVKSAKMNLGWFGAFDNRFFDLK